MKRFAVGVAVCAALGLNLVPSLDAHRGGEGSARLNLVEATISDLLKAMQTRLISAEDLVEMYMARIEAYDDAGPGVNAFIHVNTDAAVDAYQQDLHRHPGRHRRPLEGIPVLLKDNIDTADMPTTAGSVALEGSMPPDDAFITRRLREAGAIIIGKAVDTPWPISPTWQPIVTAPSASMRMKGPICPTNRAAARPAWGRAKTSRAPAPAAALSSARREVVKVAELMRRFAS